MILAAVLTALAALAAGYVLLPLIRVGRSGGAPPAAALRDAEALIAYYKSHPPACRRCGPRPERDALFCSTCGRKL